MFCLDIFCTNWRAVELDVCIKLFADVILGVVHETNEAILGWLGLSCFRGILSVDLFLL